MIGNKMDLNSFMNIVRNKKKIEFTEEYKTRVKKSRELVEKWVEQGRVMYGITTGFGANSTKTISKEEAGKLQRNIIITHSTSVGQPMSEEEVRATMLMILQNAGTGYSGIR